MGDMRYPVRRFEHMAVAYNPTTGVPDDDPMVTARPDLFTDKAPARKPRKPKPAAKSATTSKE